MRRLTKQEAYKAGYDAGRNGPNTDNCNFRFFATEELKNKWESGNRHGRAHAAVTAWLESQGLQCVYEILVGYAGYCDVVGFSFASRTSRLIPPVERIVAVELKMEKIAEVHRQAKRNHQFVTESYAAMPADFVVRMRPQSIQKFQDSGVGLLAVERAVGTAVFPKTKKDASDKLRRKLWRYKLKMDKEASND